MLNINKKVEWWLTNHPSLKDDDFRLCSNIWNKEIQQMGYTPADFLQLYANGKLSSAPSIKRARAKLQKEQPKFRGVKYNKRQGILQEKMRQQLGYKYY